MCLDRRDAAREGGRLADVAGQLEAEVQRTAERVAQLSPQAARLNKQALRAIAVGGAQAVVQPYAYADSSEHREGITAFLEKRKPVF